MSDEVWTAMKNLLSATENNSTAIEALARSSRSNREYLEALVHTQVVLFQLLLKELDLPPEIMVSHLSSLASNEETPANVRSLLQLHSDACSSITSNADQPDQKPRPEWYQGIIDGDESKPRDQQNSRPGDKDAE